MEKPNNLIESFFKFSDLLSLMSLKTKKLFNKFEVTKNIIPVKPKKKSKLVETIIKNV